MSIKPKKIFECFIYYLKWFCIFMFLVFVQHASLCFSSKTGSEVVLREARDLELPTKGAWRKTKVIFFIQKLSLLPHEYFATKLFSWNVFRQKLKIFKSIQRLSRLFSRLRAFRESFSMSRDFLATISLLSNPRKTRVFSFYVANVTGFQKCFTSLA